MGDSSLTKKSDQPTWLEKLAAKQGVSLQPDSQLDIVLMFDTTVSMYAYLQEVRKQLNRLADELTIKLQGVWIGVIAYGDYCDTYTTKTQALTGSFAEVKSFIQTVQGTSGGDTPEALEAALHDATQQNWRMASKKVIVLVGDAPPHGVTDAIKEYDYRQETETLNSKGVKIYSVQCGTDQNAAQVFQWLAHKTQGKYLPLENIQDLVDVIIGVCIKEVASLEGFTSRLNLENKMTGSKKKILKLLSG